MKREKILLRNIKMSQMIVCHTLHQFQNSSNVSQRNSLNIMDCQRNLMFPVHSNMNDDHGLDSVFECN